MTTKEVEAEIQRIKAELEKRLIAALGDAPTLTEESFAKCKQVTAGYLKELMAVGILDTQDINVEAFREGDSVKIRYTPDPTWCLGDHNE